MNEDFKTELGIEAPSRVTGGCIHECYRVLIKGKTLFLKCNAAAFEDAFAAEADGLAGLRRAGFRAPEPRSHGIAARRAYLLMEFLDLKGGVDFPALGRMLAQAHRKAGPRFGWQRDNYIGTTPQSNTWSDDWSTFWFEQRMKPQLELAAKRGFKLEIPSPELLQGHRPQPSLLHGDLWSGNVELHAGRAGDLRPGDVLRRPRSGSRDDRAVRGIPARVLRRLQPGVPVSRGI